MYAIRSYYAFRSSFRCCFSFLFCALFFSNSFLLKEIDDLPILICFILFLVYCSNTGFSFFPVNLWISRTIECSSCEQNDKAVPLFPARPVRPIRCTYVSATSGRSKLITVSRLAISMRNNFV